MEFKVHITEGKSPRPRERDEAQERGSEILKAAEGYPPKKATWYKRMEWETENGKREGMGVGVGVGGKAFGKKKTNTSSEIQTKVRRS